MSFKLRKNTSQKSAGFVLEAHEFSIYIDEVDICPSGRVGLFVGGRLIGFADEWVAEELIVLSGNKANNSKGSQ